MTQVPVTLDSGSGSQDLCLTLRILTDVLISAVNLFR
jgi:hypothetical protein